MCASLTTTAIPNHLARRLQYDHEILHKHSSGSTLQATATAIEGLPPKHNRTAGINHPPANPQTCYTNSGDRPNAFK